MTSYFVIVLIIMGLILIVRSFFKTKNLDCFNTENFDKTIEYTRWKQKTSKIGKVLVDGYRVEVSVEGEILFKNDKRNYTIFKVNRDKGIIILAVKQRSGLKRKANNAFCELIKRAIFHPIIPNHIH